MLFSRHLFLATMYKHDVLHKTYLSAARGGSRENHASNTYRKFSRFEIWFLRYALQLTDTVYRSTYPPRSGVLLMIDTRCDAPQASIRVRENDRTDRFRFTVERDGDNCQQDGERPPQRDCIEHRGIHSAGRRRPTSRSRSS